MIIIVALKCEASPVIHDLNLKREQSTGPFPVFSNDSVSLVISGPGKVNAAAAAAYAHACCGAQDNVPWLNIGIAGHKELEPGHALLASKITDTATGRNWYPPLVFAPAVEQAPVVTVDRPESEFTTNALYEMEASGFYEVATRFSTSELVQVLKIVSDNRLTTTKHITEKYVKSLITDRLGDIKHVINELQALSGYLNRVQSTPACFTQICERWHFSVYQRSQLKSLLQKWAALNDTDHASQEQLVLNLGQCRNGSGVINMLAGNIESQRPHYGSNA